MIKGIVIFDQSSASSPLNSCSVNTKEWVRFEGVEYLEAGVYLTNLGRVNSALAEAPPEVILLPFNFYVISIFDLSRLITGTGNVVSTDPTPLLDIVNKICCLCDIKVEDIYSGAMLQSLIDFSLEQPLSELKFLDDFVRGQRNYMANSEPGDEITSFRVTKAEIISVLGNKTLGSDYKKLSKMQIPSTTGVGSSLDYYHSPEIPFIVDVKLKLPVSLSNIFIERSKGVYQLSSDELSVILKHNEVKFEVVSLYKPQKIQKIAEIMPIKSLQGVHGLISKDVALHSMVGALSRSTPLIGRQMIGISRAMLAERASMISSLPVTISSIEPFQVSLLHQQDDGEQLQQRMMEQGLYAVG